MRRTRPTLRALREDLVLPVPGTETYTAVRITGPVPDDQGTEPQN